MATTIVQRVIEYRDIHLAVCRSRRQGLVCSTCTELSERADRVLRRFAAAPTFTRACGHVVAAVLSHDLQRAATEIEQLVTGDCGPCVKARRQSQRTLLWSEVA